MKIFKYIINDQTWIKSEYFNYYVNLNTGEKDKNLNVTGIEPIQEWNKSINNEYTGPKLEENKKYWAIINENIFDDVSKDYINFDIWEEIGKLTRFNVGIDSTGFIRCHAELGFWVTPNSLEILELTKEQELLLYPITEADVDLFKPNREILLSDNYWLTSDGKGHWRDGKKVYSTKPGRLYKRIFPTLHDSEIENMVNIFKKITTIYKWKLVKADDIVKYYNEETYASGGGSLNNSCMRYENKAGLLAIYANNPDKVEMLCLFNDKDQLVARALVWTLKGGKKFMDRIYTTLDYIEKQVIDIAISNGWGYKQKQSANSNTVIGLDIAELEVILDWVPEKDGMSLSEYSRLFPYMDTLYIYRNKKIRTLPYKEGAGFTYLRNS